MRRTAHRGFTACLGIALLAMWGCSQSPTAPVTGPDASSPPFLHVTSGPATAFWSGPGSGGGSALIDGARGGTVSNGRFQLRVPPGAFAGTATLTITVPDPSILQCDLSISPAYKNGFQVPIQLVADYGSSGSGSGFTPASASLLWFDELNRRWVKMPGSINSGSTVSTPLPHFSDYGVVDSKAGW